MVMTKIAELTPIDPTSAAHPFNPKAPLNPNQLTAVAENLMAAELLS